MKRVATRRELARSSLRRSLAQEMTRSILAERKHWVESGRAPRGDSPRH